MNFEKIPPVPSADFLLDVAFRHAREQAAKSKLTGNREKAQISKERRKIDSITDTLIDRLRHILETFPNEVELPPFYNKLIRMTLDYPQFKKSFGAVHWVVGKTSSLHREYGQKLKGVQGWADLRSTSKQFYGRISSLIKQISSNLTYLEKCRKVMRTYPDIKEMFTVCIYGFPNVGKTTLLNKLAGTNAKVAAYAFTTKSINVGYSTMNGTEVQIIDVPGTLDRPEKMNAIEQQAELVRTDLAQVLIYVFDLSGESGYSLQQQEELLQRIGTDIPVLIYVSKTDITPNLALKSFKHTFCSYAQLTARIREQAELKAGSALS